MSDSDRDHIADETDVALPWRPRPVERQAGAVRNEDLDLLEWRLAIEASRLYRWERRRGLTQAQALLAARRAVIDLATTAITFGAELASLLEEDV